MFDLLKKKFSGFVDKIKGKEEEKEELRKEEEEPAEAPGAPGKKKEPEKKEEKPAVPAKEEKEEAPAKEPAKEEVKKEEKPGAEEKKEEAPREKEEPKPEEKPEKKEAAEKPKEEKPPEEPKEKTPAKEGERPKKREEELKKKVKKGFLSRVTETIRGESEIREEEVSELIEELELGMLESDVALPVAEEIKEELRKRIIGAKVKRGETAVFVRESLKDILLKMFRENPGFEFSEKIGEGNEPKKIMVVGPNGAGKTTTIAKMVRLLKEEGYRVCIAASDTFRAAAVEQLVHHGEKVGAKVIHGAYGADPTSIAFDAVNYAKANSLDVVVIDTAGRQETNVNLLNQLRKMDRVISPDIKVYVGESIAGNAMVEQITKFKEEIGLDGVILTKLDCDAKGGTLISVFGVAKLPVLYVGVGQGYEDMKKFVPEEIVEEILS